MVKQENVNERNNSQTHVNLHTAYYTQHSPRHFYSTSGEELDL